MKQFIKVISLLLIASSAIVNAADNPNDPAATEVVSKDCRTALNKTAISSPCMSSIMDVQESDDANKFCAAVTDSAKCTEGEMNQSIKTLDTSCANELKTSHPVVLLVYTNWASLSLFRATCVKDEKGDYCPIKNITTIVKEEKCSTCELTIANNVANWVPPPTALPLDEGFNSTKVNAKELKLVCEGLKPKSAAIKIRSTDQSMLAFMLATIIGGLVFAI
ncbi:hypothetical protein BDF22DRAFT_676040 [Syncephalis plumigaleata]|nr:hypothetical protein BDF22DRAFT_676040 [Syncephalis plumigaleata]